MDNIKKHYSGDVVTNYEKSRNRQKSWQIENKIIPEFLANYLENEEIVLDVPVGKGRWFDTYKRKKVHPICVDISEDMIAAAKERANIKNINSDFLVKDVLLSDELPSADVLVAVRFFNLININDVEHVFQLCSDSGVKKFFFTIRYLSNNANVFNKIHSWKHWFIRNYKDKKRKKRKGHYFMHKEAQLNKLMLKLDLKTEKSSIIEEKRGERLIFIYARK